MEEPEEAVVAKEDEESEAEAEEEVAEAGVETSYEELFAKPAEAEEEEEESLLDMGPEERMESLSIRAVPIQANEFVCSNCHLVKHQSQLADKKRQLCRDCV